ncbi:MAG TPA: hypothetical protein VFA12_20595 [Stellaceae bacterium]|nr:hypothetical protein [Stellaceae bacterium]
MSLLPLPHPERLALMRCRHRRPRWALLLIRMIQYGGNARWIVVLAILAIAVQWARYLWRALS